MLHRHRERTRGRLEHYFGNHLAVRQDKGGNAYPDFDTGEPETDLPSYEIWRRRIAETFAASEDP